MTQCPISPINISLHLFCLLPVYLSIFILTGAYLSPTATLCLISRCVMSCSGITVYALGWISTPVEVKAVSYQPDAVCTVFMLVFATNHPHAFAGEVTGMSLR